MSAVGGLPSKVDLAVYQGDDLFLTVRVDIAVSPIDLTGYTPKSQIRATPAADVLAAFDAQIVDPVTISLHLTSLQSTRLPASAVWDVQITDMSGVVTTLAYGTITAMRQVTT